VGQRLRVLILLLGGGGLVLVLGLLLGRDSTDRSTVPPPSSVPGVQGRVKVEVLNGGGVSGAAWDATVLLRDRGFDVVFFGNAETYSEDSSVVMDRVNEPATAQKVADALGISRVVSDPDSTLLVDVTVRLGPEWAKPGSMAGASGILSRRRVGRASLPMETAPGSGPSTGP
jgi:hypothetical protein